MNLDDHCYHHLILSTLLVLHACGCLILLCVHAGLEQGLMVGGLLVLLDKRAAAAAAGRGNVHEAAAVEVVLLAHVRTLHGHGNPMEADARRTAEEKALWPM